MKATALTNVDVAVIGAGLVGKEVVRQLGSPALSPVFRVASLSNSKHTVVLAPNPPRLKAETLLSLLPTSTSPVPSSPHPAATYLPANPSELIAAVSLSSRATGRPCILIDCTSSLAVASLYPVALSSGLSVVTPNKKGFASSEQLYQDILAARRHPGAGICLGEATVGAGLPIHTTLRDLLRTGDEITKVEGVFSGTLSYLLNQYSPAKTAEGRLPKFSKIVKEAKEHGHTEPHPADDLSGADVARKLTILARMITSSPSAKSSAQPPLPQLPRGHASIPTQSLIPTPLADIADPAEFVARFSEFDIDIDALRDQAAAEGKVLRYVGLIDRTTGTVRCGLEKYPTSHPFATLSGSHLSIAFHSKRYKDRPLIVQGPGYPLSVTASAVVADAIRVAERYGARLGL
ncbi:hypothetical protein JCM11641_006765 [Rhodosporidiobolus odoratus]